MRDDLEQSLFSITAPHEQTSQVSYMIWGSVMSSTRAFKKASLKVDTNNNKVYVKVELRWIFKKVPEKLKAAWLYRARSNAKTFVPEGWRLMVFYGECDETND